MTNGKKYSAEYNKGWNRGKSKGLFDGITKCHNALAEAGGDVSVLPKIPRLVSINMSPDKIKEQLAKKKAELTKLEERLANLKQNEASGIVDEVDEVEDGDEDEDEDEDEEEYEDAE